MDKDKLLRECEEKFNIPDYPKTWKDLDTEYGIDTRSWFKRYRLKNGTLKGMYQEGRTKVLFLGDLHHPFELKDLMEHLSPYQNKVDILIIGGDEQDCQSISKFRKKYRIPFVDEMIGTRQLLINIINLLKPQKVIFLKGNHNLRLINLLSDQLNEDLLEIMPETNLDLIIHEGFLKRDRLAKTKTYFEPLVKIFPDIDIIYDNAWYGQYGDTIFCHPSAFKKAILKTAEDAWIYFLQKGMTFKNMVVFHTHAQGMFRYGEGWLIESGCLCEPQDYTDTKFYRPQANGFLYGVFDNEHFVYKDSKLVSI